MCMEYKVSLYADDLLIFLSDPLFIVNEALKSLGDFSVFCGYKINYSKSVCFPINDKAGPIKDTDILLIKIRFQVSGN